MISRTRTLASIAVVAIAICAVAGASLVDGGASAIASGLLHPTASPTPVLPAPVETVPVKIRKVSKSNVTATPLPSTEVVPDPTSVLTIGDSIMKGFGLPDGEAWPYLVSANDGWTLTTVACDGAGVLQVGSPNDCAENFAGVIAGVADEHPDVVIFEGSSNDFGLSNTELLAATISELASIKAEFPDAQIIGLSTLWGYSAAPGQLADVNSQVQQAVQQVGGTYIDIGQPMFGHPELMQGDDVHPNTAGQVVLATAIQTAVNSALEAARIADLTADLAEAHGHL